MAVFHHSYLQFLYLAPAQQADEPYAHPGYSTPGIAFILHPDSPANNIAIEYEIGQSAG